MNAHVAVVGGGISGLAAAYRLRRLLGPSARITLVDQAPVLGGKLRTVTLAGRPHDVGAEAFLVRRPEALALVTELGLEPLLVHPQRVPASLRVGGRSSPLPPRTLLGVPAGLDGLAAVLSPAGLAALMAEPDTPMAWPPPTAPAAADAGGLAGVAGAAGLAGVAGSAGWDVAVGPLVASRMGPEVAQRLVDPLLGGVYAGRADELGLRATMPALAAALDSLAAAGRPVSLTAAVAEAWSPGRPGAAVFGALLGGMTVLVDALAAAAGIETRLGLPVRALTPLLPGSSRTLTSVPAGPSARGFAPQPPGSSRASAGSSSRASGSTARPVPGAPSSWGVAAVPGGVPVRWRLELGPVPSPSFLECDAVLLAVPPPALRRLLAPLHAEASAAAAGIDVASSVIVSLALPPDVVLPACSGILVADGEPLHAKAFTYTGSKWAHTHGPVVRASLGRHGDERAVQVDDDTLVARVRADLAELTGITAAPVDVAVTRWGGGLPQYGVGHLDRVATIEAGVASLPGLAVAGAALHGVGIPACVATADAAATFLAAQLTRARLSDAEPSGTMAAWRA